MLQTTLSIDIDSNILDGKETEKLRNVLKKFEVIYITLQNFLKNCVEAKEKMDSFKL